MDAKNSSMTLFIMGNENLFMPDTSSFIISYSKFVELA